MQASAQAILDFELKWRIGVRTDILIADTARRFSSKITLTRGGLTANAKCIVSVMLIGEARPKLPDGSHNFGPDAGERLRLTVEGPDMPAAFAAMADLFTCGERVVQCRNSDCISSTILIDFSSCAIYYSCSKYHMWAVDRKTGLSPAPPLSIFQGSMRLL